MAIRVGSLLGHQVPHRTLAPSVCPLSVHERFPHPQGRWRSSGGAAPFGPCRLCERFPARVAATAPPASPPAWSTDLDCEDVMGRLRDTEKLRNCLGVPLTADEQHSLIRCLDSAQLGVDTCLVDGLPALRHHLMSYIEAVSVSQTDDLELVEGAMLLIEQLSLVLEPSNPSGPSPSSISSSSLPSSKEEAPSDRFRGQWQVLVTTGGGWPYGRLQYVPILEVLDMSADGRSFRLETRVGPLAMTASGEVRWGNDTRHLYYHVTDFRTELWGASLALPPPASGNDLRLFAVSPAAATALARSSAGGMQLLGRPA